MKILMPLLLILLSIAFFPFTLASFLGICLIAVGLIVAVLASIILIIPLAIIMSIGGAFILLAHSLVKG